MYMDFEYKGSPIAINDAQVCYQGSIQSFLVLHPKAKIRMIHLLYFST